jgi:carbamoyl-phosphate synthase small subunit
MEKLLEDIKKYTISGAVREISIKEPIRMKGENAKYNVVAVDYGSPRKQLNAFLLNGCDVTFVPAFTTAEEIMSYSPDGVVLCDGPADPDDEPVLVENIKKLTEQGVPVFAIGLGHQMLALACGFKIVKMEKGHRGSNQPVREADGTKTYITAQNHGYAVASDSTKNGKVSYVNVNDKSCEGIEYEGLSAFSVQFNPDSWKGQRGTAFLYDKFVEMMGGNR